MATSSSRVLRAYLRREDIFVRPGRKRKRVAPEVLGLLRTRGASLTEPVPGVTTFVTNDPASGHYPDAFSPGSATPGGAGRDIGKFELNTPNNGIPDRPRTLAEPGEDRGHPVNDNVSGFSRRTMTSRVAARYEALSQGYPVTSLRHLMQIAEQANVNLGGRTFRQHLWYITGRRSVRDLELSEMQEVGDWIRERYWRSDPPMVASGARFMEPS